MFGVQSAPFLWSMLLAGRSTARLPEVSPLLIRFKKTLRGLSPSAREKFCHVSLHRTVVLSLRHVSLCSLLAFGVSFEVPVTVSTVCLLCSLILHWISGIGLLPST